MKTLPIYILLLLTNFAFVPVFGQDTEFKSIYSYLPEKKAQVLLVGTFHFNYPGLDAHKTKEENKVNIKSNNKQREVEELAQYIARFKPTKIVVESGSNTGYLVNGFKEWQAGKRKLKKNEREQIGFRMMDIMGLDTIYGADSRGMVSDIAKINKSSEEYIEKLFKDYDWKSDDPIDQAYVQSFDHNDKVEQTKTLLEVFKHMNSQAYRDELHGAYLIGDFRLEKNRGADALAVYWYSRNIRIFRNIQKVSTNPDDRILVLFGAGHTSILGHLFECSPEYELIPFDSLEKMP